MDGHIEERMERMDRVEGRLEEMVRQQDRIETSVTGFASSLAAIQAHHVVEQEKAVDRWMSVTRNLLMLTGGTCFGLLSGAGGVALWGHMSRLFGG